MSCLTLLQPHGLYSTRLSCLWDFPAKITSVGCHFLLQGTFLTQRSNLSLLCLLHWQGDSLPLVPPWKSQTTVYSNIINMMSMLQFAVHVTLCNLSKKMIYSNFKLPTPQDYNLLLYLKQISNDYNL